jgi:hypothetical protein
MSKVPFPYVPPSVKLVSALDIALQCTLAKLPETLLQAAFAELAEYRQKIADHETNIRRLTMKIILYVCGGALILLAIIVAILVYLFKNYVIYTDFPL